MFCILLKKASCKQWVMICCYSREELSITNDFLWSIMKWQLINMLIWLYKCRRENDTWIMEVITNTVWHWEKPFHAKSGTTSRKIMKTSLFSEHGKVKVKLCVSFPACPHLKRLDWRSVWHLWQFRSNNVTWELSLPCYSHLGLLRQSCKALLAILWKGEEPLNMLRPVFMFQSNLHHSSSKAANFKALQGTFTNLQVSHWVSQSDPSGSPAGISGYAGL